MRRLGFGAADRGSSAFAPTGSTAPSALANPSQSKAALAGARELLKFVGSLDRVSLIHDSHAHLANYLPPEAAIHGAMFNLGYLPRGNRQIITRPDTTVLALRAVLTNLAARGRVTILVYRGHAGGIPEYVEVRQFLEQLPDDDWIVEEFASTTDSPVSPRLFRIQKKKLID